MNNALVGALASLLNKEPAVIVEALEKEDGSDVLITEFTTGHKILSAADEGKLKDNIRKEMDETFINRNLPAWKENGFPKDLYAPTKVAVLSAKQRDLKKKYGVEGESLDDIVEAAVSNAKSEKGDPNQELQDENTQLKQALKDRATEHETALAESNSRADTAISSRDLDDALNALPLDYPEDAAPKQQALIRAAFNEKFNLKVEDGKTLVVDKDGNLIKDSKVFDPVSLVDVISGVVTDYGFKVKTEDPGGRGFKGSKQTTGLAGMSSGELTAHMRDKGVIPSSAEGDKLYQEWKKANPK